MSKTGSNHTQKVLIRMHSFSRHLLTITFVTNLVKMPYTNNIPEPTGVASLLLETSIPERDKAYLINMLTKPWNPYIIRHSALTLKFARTV